MWERAQGKELGATTLQWIGRRLTLHDLIYSIYRCVISICVTFTLFAFVHGISHTHIYTATNRCYSFSTLFSSWCNCCWCCRCCCCGYYCLLSIYSISSACSLSHVVRLFPSQLCPHSIVDYVHGMHFESITKWMRETSNEPIMCRCSWNVPLLSPVINSMHQSILFIDFKCYVFISIVLHRFGGGGRVRRKVSNR